MHPAFVVMIVVAVLLLVLVQWLVIWVDKSITACPNPDPEFPTWMRSFTLPILATAAYTLLMFGLRGDFLYLAVIDSESIPLLVVSGILLAMVIGVLLTVILSAFDVQRILLLPFYPLVRRDRAKRNIAPG